MINQVIVEKIPQELKDYSQWVCWKAVPKKDKPGEFDKILVNPMNNRNASSTDPKTWTSFDKALETFEKHKGNGLNGIGYVFSADDPFIGMDLDHCVNPETQQPNDQADAWIDKLFSYTEITPSGTGIHTWVKGKKPGPRCKQGNTFELFENAKFYTVTGNRLERYPHTIELRQQEIDTLYRDIFGEDKPKPITSQNQPVKSTLSDSEILEKAKKAKNSEKFNKLMNGDYSDYPSQSEADLALCAELAFWCANNPEQIDRLFRKSKLYRKQWDKTHFSDGRTYGEGTIQKVLENPGEIYTPVGETSKGSPDIKILDMLNANEVGDARLFIELNHGKFIYDHSAGRWYVWQKHYWKEDITSRAVVAIQGVIQQYAEEIKSQNQKRLQAEKAGRKEKADQHEINVKELFKRIRVLQGKSRRDNVLDLANDDYSAIGEKSLALEGQEWDLDPMILGCKNGVIDLITGELRPGKPADYIKAIAPTEWQGIDAAAPTWKRFLNEIFDNDIDLINYVQRLFGYAITGKVTEHKFPIFYGKGRNGKGTLFETLKFVLGNLAGPVQAELLLESYRPKQSGAPTSDIMALRGKRLVWASETKEGKSLDIGKLKWLTGGDTRIGRAVFGKHEVTYSPTDTLFLLTNHKPHAPSDDYSTWQRIQEVPFNLSFVDSPKAKFERLRDPDLPTKLKEEASGILAWLVEGAMEWTVQGLKPPTTVIAATQQYKEDEDVIAHFISDRCVVKDNAHVKGREFYKVYQLWCKDTGQKTISSVRFGKDMKERFDSYKDGCIHYTGIGILAEN